MNIKTPVSQWVRQPSNPNVVYLPLDNLFYNLIAGTLIPPTRNPQESGGTPYYSTPPPPRYLRMCQRDDGIGIERRPRIPSVGNSTSVHSRVPRLGVNNRYR